MALANLQQFAHAGEVYLWFLSKDRVTLFRWSFPVNAVFPTTRSRCEESFTVFLGMSEGCRELGELALIQTALTEASHDTGAW